MLNIISIDTESKVLIDFSGVSSDVVGVFFNDGGKKNSHYNYLEYFFLKKHLPFFFLNLEYCYADHF